MCDFTNPGHYTETVSSGVPQGLVTDGAPITGSGLYFRDVPVTALASDPDATPTTKTQLAALHLTPTRWTFQYEHAGVLASNDVFYVHYNPGTGTDVFPVSVRVKPLSGFAVNNGTYAPPAVPAMTYDGESGSLLFDYPSAAAQPFTVHETDYHDAFSTSGSCTMDAATIASASPGSAMPNPNPLSPPGQDSGPATFTMAPAQAGLCTQLIKDVYGQNLGESVQVMGAFAVTPSNMTLGLNGPGQVSPTSASGTGSKIYDQYPLALTFTGTGCSGIVSVAQGTASYPGTPSTTASSMPFTVTALAPGACTLTVTDQYGESQTIGISVGNNPVYNIGMSPATQEVTGGNNGSIEIASVLSNPTLVRGNPPSSLSVEITGVSGSGCSGAYAATGFQPSTTVFVIGTMNVALAASCQVAGADSSGQTDTALIYVEPGVAPSPSPTPACTTNCSVWYEYDVASQTTAIVGLEHDETYNWLETDTLTQYVTTDGGNTWTTGNACEFYSRNAAGAYYADSYTYCNPPNADGTSTGVYSTSAYWPYTAAQMNDPDNQSYLYVAQSTTYTGRGATGTTPGTEGTCGSAIVSGWTTIAPPGIATLPFSPPPAASSGPSPC